MYFQDLQNILDEAMEGVIYFSLGTNVRSDLFPEEKKRVFIQAFSGLPQKILWKWESARLPGQPANVKIGM
jgi:glucuronosyltransferase